ARAVESETGASVGQGYSFCFPATSGTFEGRSDTYSAAVTATFREGLYGEQWDLVFLPPSGQTLRESTYTDARRSADSRHPGLVVSRSRYGYGSCGEIEGQFRILQLEPGTGSNIDALWATFDFRCIGGGGWMHGEVRYN